MRWYFASRVRHREKIIKIQDALGKQGEEILSDWVYQGSLKPYAEHMLEAGAFSEKVTDAILKADVFVLISDPEGTDMFVELGIALARQASGGKIKIYIVGEHSRRSLMQLHPAILHVKTLSEVIAGEGVVVDEFIASISF